MRRAREPVAPIPALTIAAVSDSTFHHRARLVLATFIAALCVTLVAPFMHSAVYELVCTVKGNRFVPVDAGFADDAGSTTSHDHAAHCPLCMPVGVPASVVVWDFAQGQPLSQVRRSIPSARLAGLVGAPLPARGPPPAV